MSTELYVQGYSSAGEDGLETIEVSKLPRVPPQSDDLECLALKYDGANSCELSIEEVKGKAIAMTIFRPCQHDQFWADVFNLLTHGPYLAFMPGSPAPVLVNAEVANHLPEGMADALGVPRRVSTVAETVSHIIAD